VRRLACFGGALAVFLTAAPTASAHFKSGVPSTDYEARIASLVPPEPGVRARTLDGDLRLELSVPPPRVVVVVGLLGEPFLRFSPAGVEANLASPTATSMGVVSASQAVRTPAVDWHRVSDGHTFAWHEHRLRPVSLVRSAPAGGRAVASWSIPLIVDGRPARLTGSEWYAPPPPMWPWLLAGAVLLAAAVIATRRLSRRDQRRLAGTLLPIAVGALLAAWFGTIFVGRAEVLTTAFALVFAGTTALLLYAAVTAARGRAQLAVMALIGAVGAAFATPEIAVFQHGFVLAVLPDVVERVAVATAVVAGLMTAIVGAPAVGDLLGIEAPRHVPRHEP
jgi:hypothetical protein